jgi:protease I
MAISHSKDRNKLRVAASRSLLPGESNSRPQKALEDTGAKVDVIARQSGIKAEKIRAWDVTDWGDEIQVNVVLSSAKGGNYDTLHLSVGDESCLSSARAPSDRVRPHLPTRRETNLRRSVMPRGH